jgi:hypothetical protein
MKEMKDTPFYQLI